MASSYCPVHGCFTFTCGGHKEVFTSLGWEVLKVDEPPKGEELRPTEEDLAKRWSTQK